MRIYVHDGTSGRINRSAILTERRTSTHTIGTECEYMLAPLATRRVPSETYKTE